MHAATPSVRQAGCHSGCSPLYIHIHLAAMLKAIMFTVRFSAFLAQRLDVRPCYKEIPLSLSRSKLSQAQYFVCTGNVLNTYRQSSALLVECMHAA